MKNFQNNEDSEAQIEIRNKWSILAYVQLYSILVEHNKATQGQDPYLIKIMEEVQIDKV